MPPKTQIVDITNDVNYEKYLYKCLAPAPFRRYSRRHEYLVKAIPKGLRKKLLISEGKVVGQIEYAPAEASGYPIVGNNIIVMNCIWVLRRAKGHSFGKLLIEDMIRSEKNADGFATVALENHWSPWLRKWQMEKLGFMPLDRVDVSDKARHREIVFSIYLMWMPTKKSAELPSLDKQKILWGETFCFSHPLYRPQTWKETIFDAKTRF